MCQVVTFVTAYERANLFLSHQVVVSSKTQGSKCRPFNSTIKYHKKAHCFHHSLTLSRDLKFQSKGPPK